MEKALNHLDLFLHDLTLFLCSPSPILYFSHQSPNAARPMLQALGNFLLSFLFLLSIDSISKTFHSLICSTVPFHKRNMDLKDLFGRKDPGLLYRRWWERKNGAKEGSGLGSGRRSFPKSQRQLEDNKTHKNTRILGFDWDLRQWSRGSEYNNYILL